MAQDLQIELSELQEYQKAGCLDSTTLKKLNKAIQDGKTYAYINSTDYAELQRRFNLYKNGYAIEDRSKVKPKSGNGVPRPKADEPKSETKLGRIATYITGFAVLIIIVFIFFSKSAKENNAITERVTDTTSVAPIEEMSAIGIDASPAAPEPKPSENPTPIDADYSLTGNIKSYLHGIDATYLDSKQDETCYWVMVSDDGHDWDAVANGLCLATKNNRVKCITLFNAKMERLARSMCN